MRNYFYVLYAMLISMPFCPTKSMDGLEEREINRIKFFIPSDFKINKSENRITNDSISTDLVIKFRKILFEEKNVDKAINYAKAAIINDIHNINEEFINYVEDFRPGIIKKIRERNGDYNKQLKSLFNSMISTDESSEEK